MMIFDLSTIKTIVDMMPIYNKSTKYLNLEDKWVDVADGSKDGDNAIIDWLANDMPIAMARYLYPIGISLDFAIGADPNTLFAGSGMTWALEEPGNVMYTANQTPTSEYYVGKVISADGNARYLPVQWHEHGLKKHGHLIPNFSGIQAYCKLNAFDGFELPFRAFRSFIKDKINYVISKEDGPNGLRYSMRGMDFNPQTPSSSAVYIGEKPPQATPPTSWPFSAENTTTEPDRANINIPGTGNIDSLSRHLGSIAPDLAQNTLTKNPFFIPGGGNIANPDTTGVSGTGTAPTIDNKLSTYPAGTQNATLDVRQKGKCYLKWTRTA